MMIQAEINILQAIASSGGVAHYKSLVGSGKRFEYTAGLANLVHKGFVNAYGSREWTDALFSLTVKGRTTLDEYLRDNPPPIGHTDG